MRRVRKGFRQVESAADIADASLDERRFVTKHAWSVNYMLFWILIVLTEPLESSFKSNEDLLAKKGIFVTFTLFV
jgi:hypothetical protein